MLRTDRHRSKRMGLACGRCVLTSGLLLMLQMAAVAQSSFPYHQPLNQHQPHGMAAGWLNHIRKYDPTWMQPVRIEVPGDGEVTLYSGSNDPVGVAASPALFAVNAGHVYRLRVTGMSEFPGLEIYPTVEILDHLHPPAGHENEFPIPIPLTDNDIRIALTGQMVTKIIYLEQPQISQALDPLRREIPQTVLPHENALSEADHLGRAVVMVRIGGRRPSASTLPSFYGTGGGAEIRNLDSSDAGVVRIGAPVHASQSLARR